jgi:Domain of unknown function (DUF5658)
MAEEDMGTMTGRLAAARIRETKFLMSFNMPSLNNKLVYLLSIFVVLTFFDATTTLVAINTGTFVELNPIANGLFQLDFPGFLIALVLKYSPMIPLAYITFLPDNSERPMPLRIVKVSALVALAASDIFYSIVVGSNSANLLAYYL